MSLDHLKLGLSAMEKLLRIPDSGSPDFRARD